MKNNSIFLIGPMGAGKSTIGRLLSEELNIPFIDSDKEIEENDNLLISVFAQCAQLMEIKEATLKKI